MLLMKFLPTFKSSLNLLVATCLGPGFHPRGVSQGVTKRWGLGLDQPSHQDTWSARNALALRGFSGAGDVRTDYFRVAVGQLQGGEDPSSPLTALSVPQCARYVSLGRATSCRSSCPSRTR